MIKPPTNSYKPPPEPSKSDNFVIGAQKSTWQVRQDVRSNEGMISREQVRHVWRLVQEGQLSRPQIAAQVGVSRTSVISIATGKRGLHGREDNGAPAEEAVEPTLCEACGNWVPAPCVYCAAQAYRRRVCQGILEPANHATGIGPSVDDPTAAQIADRALAVRRTWSPQVRATRV